MKTKSLPVKRINIQTLGCAKNVYDSEVFSGNLKKAGISVVHEADPEPGDVIVINTCGFVQDAKQESIDTILEFTQLKQDNQIDKLYVVGCLSQRYLQDLTTEFPEVDKFFGLGFFSNFMKEMKIDYKSELAGERFLSTPSHFAYLKISDGCNHKCSFCAIPLIKGKFQSVPLEVLVDEAQTLSDQGVKELILIAQDSTGYGIDLYGKRKIVELIRRLSDIKGIEWIRIQYAYPTGFPIDLLDEIALNPKVCKYLDLPFQHISDKMLKIMRRGIDKKGTYQLIEQIKNKVPGISLRSSFIVGHPSETKKDYEELKSFITDVKFDRLGVFMYSHEEGTYSYQMFKDSIGSKQKKERADELMQIQQQISLENNIKKVGNTYKTIIDRKEGGFFIGRTEHDTPEVDNEVLIKDDGISLVTGSYYDVRIIEAMEYDLVGKVVIE